MLERARDSGTRIPMLEAPELRPSEDELIDLFWGLRALAPDGEAPLSINTVVTYLSLDRQTRSEVDLFLRLDHGYRAAVADIAPERRRPTNAAGLRLVKE